MGEIAGQQEISVAILCRKKEGLRMFYRCAGWCGWQTCFMPAWFSGISAYCYLSQFVITSQLRKES